MKTVFLASSSANLRAAAAVVADRPLDLQRTHAAIQEKNRATSGLRRDERLTEDDVQVVIDLEWRCDGRADAEQQLQVELPEPLATVDVLLDPEVGAQTHDQLLGEERLGQVVVGPGLEARQLVLELVAGGEDQHGDVTERLVALQDSTNLVAVALGEHQVQQDDVRSLVAGQLQSALAGLGEMNREPLGLELLLQDAPEDVGIVHHKDGMRLG
jgi:hypothetical protein